MMSNDFRRKVVRSVSSLSLEAYHLQIGAPIQPLVRPEIPFEVWSVDCIGPLNPPSRRNHHFNICAVDLGTRWARGHTCQGNKRQDYVQRPSGKFAQQTGGILKVWVSSKGGTMPADNALNSTTGMSPFLVIRAYRQEGKAKSWLDLRSRLRFRDLHYASNRYGCIIYGDVTDHISSDCQELDDVQRLELLNTLENSPVCLVHFLA
ncbi:hypothetical protein TNCV_373471 [Trichonephila clavipes]|nr:hypothetical protein TNCV_373471 [Trichonephila clavipes]